MQPALHSTASWINAHATPRPQISPHWVAHNGTSHSSLGSSLV